MSNGVGAGRLNFMPQFDGPPVTTRRKCLCCRKEFDSTGAGNRLCGVCRGRSQDLSPFAL